MNFADFVQCLKRKGAPDTWSVMSAGTEKAIFWNELHSLRVEVDKDFNCFLVVMFVSFNIQPNNNTLYLQKTPRKAELGFDLAKKGLKSLLSHVASLKLCPGLDRREALQVHRMEELDQFHMDPATCWAANCQITLLEKELCPPCVLHQKRMKDRARSRSKASGNPLNRFTLLKTAAHGKLMHALNHQRKV